MNQEDIEKVIEEFYQAAVNTKRTGADGIEIHGANGYIVD